MRARISHLLVASFFGVTVLSNAHAATDACGNIQIDPGAHCEVKTDYAACAERCEPMRLQAACSAILQQQCKQPCASEASEQCGTSCQSACADQCNAAPSEFDCQGSCRGECEVTCEDACSDKRFGTSEQAECETSCRASCAGDCNASCEGITTDSDCDASCEASCDGECTAKAGMECQLECQAEGYRECLANMEGTCETECEVSERALFCNGQYIAHGGDLDRCLATLQTQMHTEIEGATPRVQANVCVDGDCAFDPSQDVAPAQACAVAEPGRAPAGNMAWLGLLLLPVAWRLTSRRAAS